MGDQKPGRLFGNIKTPVKLFRYKVIILQFVAEMMSLKKQLIILSTN
jgi:hypothetical protein